jgi:hypothetical protein
MRMSEKAEVEITRAVYPNKGHSLIDITKWLNDFSKLLHSFNEWFQPLQTLQSACASPESLLV